MRYLGATEQVSPRSISKRNDVSEEEGIGDISRKMKRLYESPHGNSVLAWNIKCVITISVLVALIKHIGTYHASVWAKLLCGPPTWTWRTPILMVRKSCLTHILGESLHSY